ncbi:InlB B-repeat-containing protein [Bifidobacterium sp. W8103]|nr:InlB B-repeat-containing protein [Bifidobacterium sp. W8103]
MRFNPGDGSRPTQSTVKTGTLATPPQQNPQRQGFRFDGWTLDGQPFDFQTPILQDTTLKARWSKVTDWVLSPDHGPATGALLTISPPDRQEPYYTSIQASGEQILGLTGDGRIYTWTQDSRPKQVPSPAQAPDGFHYLLAAAGSRWQAAIGSDQHIYTWASQQSTPAVLDTWRNAKFTSISLNGDRLLAVDQQGQVHAFQARQADSQNQNPELIQQAATSLPGKAQAVAAVASPSRTLIVDSDGQAWTWEMSSTRKAKPSSIKQNPKMRIIQAQALSQGFLLLDADGQAWYLADSTVSMTPVSLPDGVQTSRITVNDSLAMITGTDGHVWAWKPGSKPTRADNGNQQYMQATEAGNRITAISRQGSMFTWSLDPQNNPGKPARVDSTQAPILETASLDGQPLKLSRKNSSWQTETPARKPGSAVITITGRQDGQPFTRSLNYTVDQTLTRGTEPRSTLTVHFDTGGGKPEPGDQSFPAANGRVKRPSPDPARQGFLFDGWFIGQVAYNFSKPVDKDLTLTAHWSPAGRNSTWGISPDKGSQLGRESTTITPPDSASRGIRFNQVSASTYLGGMDASFSLAVGSDGNAYAWGYNDRGQLGDGTTTTRHMPVRVKTPDRNTYPDLPKDFTYVQVSAGSSYSLAVGSDGNTYAWGYNDRGQLGDGTTTSRSTPVRVRKPAGKTVDFTYLQVSAGYSHSLAVGSDGNTYAWGTNNWGEIGDGTSSYPYIRTTPVMVRKPTGLTYMQVSAGCSYSLAVGSDGNAYAWGYNYYGELGNASNTNRYTPVKVRKPAGKTADFIYMQVSAGVWHSLAVGSDGNTYAWGYNYCGELGNDSIPTGSYRDAKSSVPVPVSFNLQLVITGVRFDQTAVSGLTRGDGGSVSVLTPAHQPGTVTVSVDYTLGGAPQTPDTSLRYTYLPAGVLPKAGGEGILLALTTGMTGMGGVLASRRHRREQHQLVHASHE